MWYHESYLFDDQECDRFHKSGVILSAACAFANQSWGPILAMQVENEYGSYGLVRTCSTAKASQVAYCSEYNISITRRSFHCRSTIWRTWYSLQRKKELVQHFIAAFSMCPRDKTRSSHYPAGRKAYAGSTASISVATGIVARNVPYMFLAPCSSQAGMN